MDSLAAGARALLNLELTSAQLAAFQTYADELRAWSTKFNLTAIKDLEGIQIKHFLDSLSILKVLSPAPALADGGRLRTPRNAPVGPDPGFRTPRSAATGLDFGLRTKLVDVGTGAGFPGLPLKIVCPQMQLILVEATGKKVTFCRQIVEKLKLSQVTVIKARAEEVGRDPSHREQYDWAVARAVAEMPALVEYLLPLVKRGGHALAQKGEGAPAETHSAEGAARRLGGELEQIFPVELPGIAETRYLVVFRKVAATPPVYPRRPGVPTKAPLK